MIGVAQVLADTRAQGRAALIGYLPVGFPDKAMSIAAMETTSLTTAPVEFLLSAMIRPSPS